MRYSRHKHVVVARLLDAAQAEFMAAGYAGASTNRIVAAFGGSKATLFRHFPTKKALFEAVIRRIAERMRGKVRWQEIASGEPRAWLTALGRMSLAAILVEEALFVGKMVIAEGTEFPEVRDLFIAIAIDPILAALAARLRAWDALGLLACDDPESDAVLYFDLVLSGPVSRALYGVPKAELDHLMVRAIDLFLTGRLPR